jgi:hypothetical protein
VEDIIGAEICFTGGHYKETYTAGKPAMNIILWVVEVSSRWFCTDTRVFYDSWVVTYTKKLEIEPLDEVSDVFVQLEESLDLLNDIAELHIFAARRNARDSVEHGYKVHGDGLGVDGQNVLLSRNAGGSGQVDNRRIDQIVVRGRVSVGVSVHNPDDDQDVFHDEGGARHESQADHGDHGGGEGVDVPATTPPTDSQPQVLTSWQVPKFNVFMEQPTNTAKFIDKNDDLGNGEDNKLIHVVATDGDVHDGEGNGGNDQKNRQFVRLLYPMQTCLEDVSGKRLLRPPTPTLTPMRRSTTLHEQLKQMPRFKKIVYEFANNNQQAGINDITVVCDALERDDGGGQARGGHGGEGGCIQVHGEPGLKDRHDWGQVRDEEIMEQSDNTSNSSSQLAEIEDITDDLGHDETGGPVQDEVGLEDDDRGGEFRADTELGDDEEGVGDARPVKRKRPNKKYSADVFDISMIRARCPAPNPIVR